jgi:hypothetical protein
MQHLPIELLAGGSDHMDIVVHGLQEDAKCLVFALESCQLFKDNINIGSIEEMLPKVMQHIHLQYPFLQYIFILGISPQTSSTPVTPSFNKTEIYKIHSIGIIKQFFLLLLCYLDICGWHAQFATFSFTGYHHSRYCCWGDKDPMLPPFELVVGGWL